MEYQRRKNFWFKRLDNIIVVFSFERPSNLVYFQFSIMPLFMPNPGYIYYTYGSRFNNIFPDVPILCGNSTETEEKNWSDRIIYHLKEDIVPFCCTISTADGMNCFFKLLYNLPAADGKMCNYMCCSNDNLILLQMYYSIFQKKYAESIALSENYISYLSSSNYYTTAIAQRKAADIQAIYNLLLKKKNNELSTLCEKWVAENLRFFHIPI